MNRFFEKGLTVKDLKKLVDEAIEKGCGDALVVTQADVDGISDIVINGFEGCGKEFGGETSIFSLVSVKDGNQFKRIYGAY